MPASVVRLSVSCFKLPVLISGSSFRFQSVRTYVHMFVFLGSGVRFKTACTYPFVCFSGRSGGCVGVVGWGGASVGLVRVELRKVRSRENTKRASTDSDDPAFGFGIKEFTIAMRMESTCIDR